jgi:predicted nucleic acid-binding protein
MKGLDTSVLAALLMGHPGARNLLTRLHGVELATTEINLLELAYLAARGPDRSRTAHHETIERLRRRLTVIPIDARAVQHAGRRLGKGSEKAAVHVLAMLGAFETNGCDELFTYEKDLTNSGKWRFRITILKHSHT